MSAQDTLTSRALAGMIDHTFLKAFGSDADISTLCEEAMRHRFACVIVNPAELERCAGILKGSGIPVGTVIGFPLGQNVTAVKEFEMRDAAERGATELDMVINVRALHAGRVDLVKREMESLARVCDNIGGVSKVILETCYLSDPEKRQACAIARDAGIDFVKTSTGLGAGGATAADIRLMRAAVGPAMGVKASGGIRNLAAALAMIEAGANRLGTSGGVAIVKELATREKGNV